MFRTLAMLTVWVLPAPNDGATFDGNLVSTHLVVTSRLDVEPVTRDAQVDTPLVFRCNLRASSALPIDPIESPGTLAAPGGYVTAWRNCSAEVVLGASPAVPIAGPDAEAIHAGEMREPRLVRDQVRDVPLG